MDTIQNEPSELQQVQSAQPEVPVSVDATWSKPALIGLLIQAVVALGSIITFLGLGDTLWIVKAQRFLASDQGVPVIAAIATVASIAVGLYRTRGRQLKMSFLAALLPDRISTVNGQLHAAVQAKVDQATAAGLVTKMPNDPTLK